MLFSCLGQIHSFKVLTHDHWSASVVVVCLWPQSFTYNGVASWRKGGLLVTKLCKKLTSKDTAALLLQLRRWNQFSIPDWTVQLCVASSRTRTIIIIETSTCAFASLVIQIQIIRGPGMGMGWVYQFEFLRGNSRRIRNNFIVSRLHWSFYDTFFSFILFYLSFRK